MGFYSSNQTSHHFSLPFHSGLATWVLIHYNPLSPHFHLNICIVVMQILCEFFSVAYYLNYGNDHALQFTGFFLQPW